MRVVNLFDPSKAAGPALDIYDVQLNNPNTTTKPVPIISAVAYGAFSDYVHLTPDSARTWSTILAGKLKAIGWSGSAP